MNSPAQRHYGMSKSEIALLLAFVAAYDQRTIGEADVEAWHLASQYANWESEAAKRAVVAHYAQSRQRIMPGDVTAGIRGESDSPWAGVRYV